MRPHRSRLPVVTACNAGFPWFPQVSQGLINSSLESISELRNRSFGSGKHGRSQGKRWSWWWAVNIPWSWRERCALARSNAIPPCWEYLGISFIAGSITNRFQMCQTLSNRGKEIQQSSELSPCVSAGFRFQMCQTIG